MADASVEFLLKNLKELQLNQAHLLNNTKDQVEKVDNYLRLFKTFLRDAPRQCREDETLWKLIRSVRNAVYEAEDIIDDYVTQIANRVKPKINKIAEKVNYVLEKFEYIFKNNIRILDIANINEDGWTKHIESTQERRGKREGTDSSNSSMADASIDFLLKKLKELQIHKAYLLEDTMDQVEKVENYLRLFKTFLRDAPRLSREDKALWELILSVRTAVYEAEDIIGVYVTRTTNKVKRKINRIAEKVNSVLQKFEYIFTDIANIKVEDGWTKHMEGPQVRETNVVGFEDEVQRVKGFLFEESQELEAISIVGMPGLGKTTLVGKIYLDPDIQNEFPTRIWVHVSREFTEKDIFLAILKEFTTITNDLKSRTEKELTNLVMSYLENRRFLLVMDEVWSSEDWDKLKVALPSTTKRGKVLITCRWAELGWHVNHRRGPHMLRCLTAEESLLLLQLEVSREVNITGEWEVEGRLIAEKCGGLALAIVVMGGILVNIAKQYSHYPDTKESEEIKIEWKDVSESFDTHFIYEDQEKRMDKIILLNYAKLPNHLRECFLYFGMFPKHFEIPAWQLICFWIAEGFIQEEDGVSLEETAESYLEELINRNLVIAEKFRANGKVKTCCIHHMLRDFCLNEAGIKREGFLQEIKISSDGIFQPSVYEELTFHRLSIRSSALEEFVSSKPFSPIVRSFVYFSRYEVDLSEAEFSAIPKGFKQLRILHAKHIKFTRLPRDLCQLSHLRYLVLFVEHLEVFPSTFSKLWNIQTLVVRTRYLTLDIKADILNMSQLRHFKTNAAAVLPKASESSKRACEQIQTLGNIDPESCNEDVFDRARNLRKLGVRGNLLLLLDEKSGSFESLAKLSNLENLKLQNYGFHVQFLGVRLHLPPAYNFPPKLKILTLSQTFLDWCHMSIIGSLDKLEVLKLKNNAFHGEIWEATDGGFRHLQVLHIGDTNLKIWLASHHHFPRLKHLQLKYCQDLEQVPIELAHVPSFLKLDLYCSIRCAASAKKIEAKIKKNDQYSGTAVRQFSLSIYP